MKPKVLIIFPSNNRADSHYPYWLELFDSVQKKLDLKMLIETRHTLIGRLVRIFAAAQQGYTTAYIHYSYSAVILSKIVSLFLPMKIYYWNCEKYTQGATDVFLPTILKMIDVLVTGSSSLADNYRRIFKLGSKPIKIVPNYVTKNMTHATCYLLPATSHPHILFVHHLSPRKGTRELPLIIADTIKKVPNAHFHIIGSGPDYDYLVRANNHSPLRQHTTIYGALPHAQTAGFFKSCDYFIMPSRSEGFPRVILEAMISKLPFVATKVGNVTEIVAAEQQRWLVAPRHPHQFSSALIKLIHAKNKQKIASANYAVATHEYTQAKAVSAFINLFQSV